MAKKNKHVREYMTRAGVKQFKPSVQLVMVLRDAQQGFCLACGTEVPGVEPDACRDACPDCGKPKVYGAEELVIMGLTFDADIR